MTTSIKITKNTPLDEALARKCYQKEQTKKELET